MAGCAPPLAGSVHNPPGGELNWSMRPAQESFRSSDPKLLSTLSAAHWARAGCFGETAVTKAMLWKTEVPMCTSQQRLWLPTGLVRPCPAEPWSGETLVGTGHWPGMDPAEPSLHLKGMAQV